MKKKIKNKYVYIEHSHLFYEKFNELLKYGNDLGIINKHYDLKKIKLFDKN